MRFPCGFLVEFRKNIYTEEYLRKLGLNERQQKAVLHVKTTGKITNQELRELTDVVIKTASRDIEDLVRKGVLVKMGKTGRSIHYVLTGKLDTNWTNRTWRLMPERVCVPDMGHLSDITIGV